MVVENEPRFHSEIRQSQIFHDPLVRDFLIQVLFLKKYERVVERQSQEMQFNKNSISLNLTEELVENSE